MSRFHRPSGRTAAAWPTSILLWGQRRFWTVPVEDQGGRLKAGTPEQFLKTQFSDFSPVFSADGRWLAYQSNESGTNEIYVRGFPAPTSGQGSKWQISNRGGAFPVWSRSGRELLYQAGDQMMTASYTVNGDSFVAEKPRVWVAKLGGALGFDLAPDGKRALVLAPGGNAGRTEARSYDRLLPELLRRAASSRPRGQVSTATCS